jgi:hypothetical protein
MKEHPIIFNGEMVRAILDGRKTQTRRIMKPQPKPTPDDYYGKKGHQWPSKKHQSMLHVEGELQNGYGNWNGLASDACPLGAVGEHLWVRETFCIGKYEAEDKLPGYGGEELYISQCLGDDDVIYKQHAVDIGCNILEATWKPSIHMPRSACRIILQITNIRVERLQEINEQDASAEGMTFTDFGLNQFGNQQPGWLWRKSSSHEECLCSAKFAFANLWTSIYGGRAWSDNPWVWVIEFKVLTTNGVIGEESA